MNNNDNAYGEDLLPPRHTPKQLLSLTRRATEYLLTHPVLRRKGTARELGFLLLVKTVMIGQPSGELSYRDVQAYAMATGRSGEIMQREIRLLRASGFLRSTCRRYMRYHLDEQAVLAWVRQQRRAQPHGFAPTE
jgi:hypothetical protein